MKIEVLPDNVANQIAAGEVIQRPASVVKELMENAIDAGANKIKVNIKDSGRTLIQVIDNGSGMSEMDARLSLERHATSKIRKADDLFHITSMGFRGEAIPSIVSVSHTEIKSKRAEDDLGTLINVEGSEVVKQEPTAGVQGSSFSVRNLFYNIPARRKFLKSDNVEYKHIVEQFLRLAIPFHQISFELNHGDKSSYNLPTSNFRQRIVGVYGKSYNDKLVPVKEELGILSVDGFVGKPDAARKTRGEQYFFVNDRFIKSSYLNHAVLGAFEELIPQGYHPSYFLRLHIDPERIDVNIHPTKTEIKFIDEASIYAIIKATVKKALGENNIAPTLDFSKIPSLDQLPDPEREIPNPAVQVDSGYNPFKSHSTGKDWELMFKERPKEEFLVESEVAAMEKLAVEQEEETSKVFLIGNGYAASRIKSGLMVMHIQRCLERIYYERNLHALANNVGKTQKQLFPQTIELNPIDLEVVTSMKDQFGLLGYDLESLGQQTISINGVPSNLGEADPIELLESLIKEYQETEQSGDVGSFDRLARSAAMAEAKGFRRVLKEEEIESVVDQLFACEQAYFTPSGAPTIVTIPFDELEKKFAK